LIRRAPFQLAGVSSVEQHLVTRGIHRILTAEKPGPLDQPQACNLKTIGWCMSAMVNARPKEPDQQSGG